MILKHELESLNEDELALLYYIASKENTNTDQLDFISSIRKEYLIFYYLKNKKKFNDKGHIVYKSLIEKLTPNSKQNDINV